MTNIHEITCKSLLNKSGIPGIDYTVNPYTGCLHGCVYCYARFMSKYTKHRLPWGIFCDVKANAVEVLEKEIRKRPRGLVSLSTVTDPYQELERKYQLTRNIMIRLAESQFPVSILTKSDLVLRDLDVLRQFRSEDCEVGFSINTLDENVRKQFEPGAPPVARRIQALKTLHKAGIRTWLFAAPVLPILTEQSIFKLFYHVKDCVDRILFDTLNLKCGNWNPISRALKAHNPSLLPGWMKILFSSVNKTDYYGHLFRRCQKYCMVHHIQIETC